MPLNKELKRKLANMHGKATDTCIKQKSKVGDHSRGVYKALISIATTLQCRILIPLVRRIRMIAYS